MKILSYLPDKKYFRSIPPTERWPYIWEAIASPKLRVCSEVVNPWDREWEIWIKEQNAKTDRSIYVNRIDLQCRGISGEGYAPKANIVWEMSKGIPSSTQPTLRFYAIPARDSQGPTTIMLSIVQPIK